MRIRRIKIRKWRHFSNIEINLEEDAPLVCIVGANGTGKSHILELIAACAHRFGLAQGIQINRGQVFNDPHDIELHFHLAKDVSDAVDIDLAGEDDYNSWDRAIILCSNTETGTNIISAGGIHEPSKSRRFASLVIERLRTSKEVHFVSLDADRSYPKKNFGLHQLVEAYQINWETVEYTRGRSFMPTSTLYDEWLRFFFAQENMAGNRLMQEARRAKKTGEAAPEFEDHFQEYAKSVQKVLPHLEFSGVDAESRTLLFNTTGLRLSFDQLSGGEREIAFLIGQIDRFGLRQGLFLIDEPELHLNADLIRTWVGYLLTTVKQGQIWLATHSLEAVEAAGQQATFVLERSAETKQVDRISRLDDRPILASLSRSVGTPAFSISQLLFVYIEGEDGIGEREHYQKLSALGQKARFIEAGSGTEVIRRVDAIKSLASGADTGIRIAGIVDRDFKSPTRIAELLQAGIFTLPVHEAENFHLHPATLAVLLSQNGGDPNRAMMVIRDAADKRAGSWIFQFAMATPNARNLPEIPHQTKDLAKNLSWPAFEEDQLATIKTIAITTGFAHEDAAKFESLMCVAAKAYTRKRMEDGLWKECEGKQVLSDVARAIGFTGVSAMTQATFAAWSRGSAAVSDELTQMRDYLATF